MIRGRWCTGPRARAPAAETSPRCGVDEIRPGDWRSVSCATTLHYTEESTTSTPPTSSLSTTSTPLPSSFSPYTSPPHIPHPAGTSEEKILEHQFDLFNGQLPSPHSTAYYRTPHRSLSVGDLVAIGDRFYTCDHVGWTLCDAAPADNTVVSLLPPPPPSNTEAAPTDLEPELDAVDIDLAWSAVRYGEQRPAPDTTRYPRDDEPPF